MTDTPAVSVLFVCLGNICRSPLAEGVFRHQVEQAGLGGRFEIDSAGTSAYHRGEAPDPGSIKVARKHGIDISGQRSRQVSVDDFELFDLILAMDRSNHHNLLALVGDVDRVRGQLWLMRNFEHEDDGSGLDEDVPDPWGGGLGGFEEVYGIVQRSGANLLTFIKRQQGW